MTVLALQNDATISHDGIRIKSGLSTSVSKLRKPRLIKRGDTDSRWELLPFPAGMVPPPAHYDFLLVA